MEVKGEVTFYVDKDESGDFIANRYYLLHSEKCKNSDQDIAIMKCKLIDDPKCIERKDYCLPARNTEKCTALFDAVFKDHHKCVAFMITRGSNIWEIYRWFDIIETCLYRHRFKTLKYLIHSKMVSPIFNPENSGIVNALNASNFYLLVAVKKDCGLDIINLFLKLGVKVDDFVNYNLALNHCPFKMPAFCALDLCQPLVLKTLILYGGAVDDRNIDRDLDDESKDCLSLIHHYVLFSYTNLREALLLLYILYEFGANLWQCNRHGMTPIEVRQNLTALNRELIVRRIHQDNENEASAKVTPIISTKIQELMTKPLSLKSWSRIALITDKKSNYLNYLDQLEGEVPREVMRFLRTEEITLDSIVIKNNNLPVSIYQV
jgi:hypothetical protein